MNLVIRLQRYQGKRNFDAGTFSDIRLSAGTAGSVCREQDLILVKFHESN